MKKITLTDLVPITSNLWEIPQSFCAEMRVPARIYASKSMLLNIAEERAFEQLVNITTLPGIAKYALAMPDIHQGYGFPIGGVAAFNKEDGIISPGGVGYDINCGVRLLATPRKHDEIMTYLEAITNHIFRDVPSGVGCKGNLLLNAHEFDQVLNQGMQWALSKGYATAEDLNCAEEQGCFRAANADLVSARAKERGYDQLGTLGSGNHFVEVQTVSEVYDAECARIFGLEVGQVVIMIHTGSRGLGHQVCTDYVRNMNEKNAEYKIKLVDRELACAPFNTAVAQEYYQAMAAAANFAWANRQIITYRIRKAWQEIFGGYLEQLQLVYDVSHNIAKLEAHANKHYIVHRKGATRAFAPHHLEIPEKYQITGQPVLIPGSMGTCSYVLAGTETAMQNSFGSTCHGAGRRLSRSQSKKLINYRELLQTLMASKITVRCESPKDLPEEAPAAYKDVNEVVEVVCREGLCKKVARLKPVAVIKG